MDSHSLPGLRSSSIISPASFHHTKNRWTLPVCPWSWRSSSSRSHHPIVKGAVRFRPCIGIHKGKVKQIVGSTLQDSVEGTLVTNFESDKSPAEFTNLYKQDGLTGGHVIMLGADAASRTAAIEALQAYPGGMQVGGGINVDNAQSYLEEGASHVSVTSYVFSDGQMDLQRLKRLVHAIGKHRLVLDLSCRKRIPVTYAGGVTSMVDMERIKNAGKGRVDVTVGSALDIFGGDLSYKEVVAWHDDPVMASR